MKLMHHFLSASQKLMEQWWRRRFGHTDVWFVRIRFEIFWHRGQSRVGGDNTNDNPNDIILTMKDKKFYFPTVTLSTKENRKISKLLSKGFERSLYWNEFKTKSKNKNTTYNYKYFIESNFLGVKTFWLIKSKMIVLKDSMAKNITYLELLSKIITSSSMKKTVTTTQLTLI